jgi:hypothetical protein
MWGRAIQLARGRSNRRPDPPLAGLSDRKQAIYLALGRRAFCRGDWSGAQIELIDLSNADKDRPVTAIIKEERELPVISEDELNSFIATYLTAQKLAEMIRKERGPIEKRRRRRDDRTGDLFGGESKG